MHDSFGTDTKPFHVGRAAQNGLMAALLAKSGLSAPLDGLEAERGWTHVVSTRENITAEFDTLGEVWETARNTFKPFPCDRIIHAAIDGWIQLREQAIMQNLDISSITNVTARTNPMVLFLTDNSDPTTGLESKFSIYHAGAIALLYGEATPSQFLDDVVQNSTVIALREKVQVTSDDTVEEHEAYVSATFADGTTVDVHVEHTIGSYENPLTAEQLKTKFLDQTRTIIGDTKAERAWETFSTIINATDVAEAIQKYSF